MPKLTVGVIALALATGVSAQDTSEYEALQDLPFEEAFAQYAEMEDPDFPVDLVRWMVRKSLADLLYPIDLRTPFAPLTEDDASSIRAFEERAGLSVDGVLTFRELGVLQRMADLAHLTRISVGSGHGVYVYGDPVSVIYASGSWSMPDIAWPLNRSEIRCDLREGICEDDTLTVSAPSPLARPSDYTGYLIHSPLTDTYEIDGWSNGILDASSVNECRRVRLTINTNTRLVTQTTEDASSQGCEILGTGERLPLIGGVRVATLIDTYEAESTYRERMESAVNAVRGPLWGAFERLGD